MQAQEDGEQGADDGEGNRHHRRRPAATSSRTAAERIRNTKISPNMNAIAEVDSRADLLPRLAGHSKP